MAVSSTFASVHAVQTEESDRALLVAESTGKTGEASAGAKFVITSRAIFAFAHSFAVDSEPSFGARFTAFVSSVTCPTAALPGYGVASVVCGTGAGVFAVSAIFTRGTSCLTSGAGQSRRALALAGNMVAWLSDGARAFLCASSTERAWETCTFAFRTSPSRHAAALPGDMVASIGVFTIAFALASSTERSIWTSFAAVGTSPPW